MTKVELDELCNVTEAHLIAKVIIMTKTETQKEMIVYLLNRILQLEEALRLSQQGYSLNVKNH